MYLYIAFTPWLQRLKALHTYKGSWWPNFLHFNSSLKINTGFNSCLLEGLASSHFTRTQLENTTHTSISWQITHFNWRCLTKRETAAASLQRKKKTSFWIHAHDVNNITSSETAIILVSILDGTPQSPSLTLFCCHLAGRLLNLGRQ